MVDLKMTYEEMVEKAQAIRKTIIYEPEVLAKHALPDDIAHTEERFITTCAGETRIHIHRPAKAAGPLPLLIYMHGGGFVKGYRENDTVLCRMLVARLDCCIVDIYYKLAPEYPYPAALNECYDVAKWACANAAKLNAIPGKLAVMGLSAGASFAAAMAIMAKDRGDLKMDLQILGYPGINMDEHPSEKAKYGTINPEFVLFYHYAYMHKALDQSRHIYASPIFAAPEQLEGIAPALIITSEEDNLRQDAEDYGLRLVQAGVPVVMKRFKKSRHAFLINFRDEYKETIDLIVKTLAKDFC